MPATWLINKMKYWEKEPSLIWQDKIFTYKDILTEVNSWMNKLDDLPLIYRQVVGLEGNYSPKICSLLLALIQRRSIIVPMTKITNIRKQEYLKTAEVQSLFMFDSRDNWRYERYNVEVKNPLTRQLLSISSPGLVLFTSGSTGKSKAALHDLPKLLEKFKKPRRRLTTINFLLFDHIGGLNTLFYTLSNGGTIVIPPDYYPDNVCKLIEKYKVELLPTTPTFLNLLLLSEAYKRYNLSSLKLITYGTEVMPESLIRRLHQAFPRIQLLQTYGLSELGILRSKSKSSDSLWVKVGGEGFETKVIDGLLWIKAHSAMVGYLNASYPFDENGWMNTGDFVEKKGEFFRFLGRQSEIINVAGQKVYPAEVESVLLEMDNVSEGVVRGEPNPITGNIVVAEVSLKKPEELSHLKKRMREFCKNRLERFKIPVKVEIREKIQHTERFKKVRNK